MKFKKRIKVQVIENHIAAQHFSNVTGMNAADYVPERQNTEAALIAETSQDKNSASDDSSDDDDEVAAAICGEESEDFEDYGSDESHSEDLINTAVNQTDDNEGSDDNIGNLVQVTRSGRSVWSWRSSVYRCE